MVNCLLGLNNNRRILAPLNIRIYFDTFLHLFYENWIGGQIVQS